MYWIDLHNHLLFGLDDGAESASESLAMARLLVDSGFREVAATPHLRSDYRPSKEQVDKRRSELQALLEEEEIPLRLHPGREIHLSPELLASARAQELECLGAGNFILLELPFGSPVPALPQFLFELRVHGYRALIAHPERCLHFTGSEDAVQKALDAGAFLQLELGSLAGIYGRTAKSCARRWLAQGLVSVLASDVHRPRSAENILRKGMEAARKHLSEVEMELLLARNPGRILQGESPAIPGE